MFNNYPKIRPALPSNIQAIYSAQYKANREGGTPASSLAQRMEAWMHRQVARDVYRPDDAAALKTLELGAGTLNQLGYEPYVTHYDIVEPFSALYQNSPQLHRVRAIFSDICDIPSATCYDRITSVATLEHICNLPELVASCCLLMKADGVFRASIPNEGSLLWTLGWKLTTGLEFRVKHGLDYGALMRHEHVNTAQEIEEILQYFYSDTQHKVFGLSKSISLYRYYECRRPRIDRCSEYLASLPQNI
jgi:hypothetical protein